MPQPIIYIALTVQMVRNGLHNMASYLLKIVIQERLNSSALLHMH